MISRRKRMAASAVPTAHSQLLLSPQKESFFHWDNAPFHTTIVFLSVREGGGALKEELAGLCLDENSLRKIWEGVTHSG